jgi:hypothetical protein
MPATVFAVNVVVPFVDEAGDKTTRRFEMKPASWTGAEDQAAALAVADALVGALEAVSNAGVSKYTVELVVTPGSTTSAQNGSEIENTAKVSMPLTVISPDQLQTYGILDIPAPDIGIFVGENGPNKNVVDYADADLQTLIGKFKSGGDFTVSDGQVATADAGSGKRIHQRSRKGRGRRIG